jgi:hypothetical protein
MADHAQIWHWVIFAYFGFYALAMCCAPGYFFGPKGMMPYWKDNVDISAEFFARQFSVGLAAMLSANVVLKANLKSVAMQWNFSTVLVTLLMPLYFLGHSHTVEDKGKGKFRLMSL